VERLSFEREMDDLGLRELGTNRYEVARETLSLSNAPKDWFLRRRPLKTTGTRSARYIAVASPSDLTNEEWKKKAERDRVEYVPPKPVFRDYALMKVLYMLRFWDKNTRVHAFKWDDPLDPLDFSGLEDSDMIFIVGHGDAGGLYALGPPDEENKEPGRNMNRLVKILTRDGNLKKKRKDKPLEILLLSCRAGLGLHKVLAHKLYNELGSDPTVGGAKGFTFGSVKTGYIGHNEVLIKGLPWYMEYPMSISRKEAEKQTSAREKKTIKYDVKRKEILKFQKKKESIEEKMKDIIKKLKSTEVNNALDEVENNFRRDWEASIMSQAMLYSYAKKKSNLDFDMWYADIKEGYMWTNGKDITSQEMDSFLKVDMSPSSAGLTSIK
jgi:hypothetical protein